MLSLIIIIVPLVKFLSLFRYAPKSNCTITRNTHTTWMYNMTVYWHIPCLPFFDQAVLFVSFWGKGEVLPQWLVHDSSVFVLWWCHVNICTHQGNHVIISVETCLVSLIPYYFMYMCLFMKIYMFSMMRNWLLATDPI